MSEIQSEKQRSKRRKGKGFRPLRWAGTLLILVVIVIVVLPFLITATPIKDSVVKWATSDFEGKITVEKLSLAWWSPVTAQGIKAIDENGEDLIFVEKFETSKSLLSLVTSAELGELTADGVAISLEMRGATTNFEEALTNYINAPANNEPLTKIKLKWSNATANITAEGYDRVWHVSDSSGTVLVGEADFPLKVSAIGKLAPDASAPQPFEVAAQIAGNEMGIDLANGTIELKGTNLETSIATPVFNRLQTPLAMAGFMNGEATIQWLDWGNQLTFSTQQANFHDLIVESAYYLGDDSISLHTAQVAGTFEMTSEGWKAENLRATTDVGQVTADGLLNVNAFIASLTSGKLPAENIRANGQVDLAKLANMLPNTFSLHSDVSVTNAILNFQLNNWVEGSDRRAILQIEAPRLEATRAGQRLQWNNPIRIAASARESNSEVAIEKLICHTDFLNIEGNGTLQQAGFTIQADLSQMNQQLGELFDLQGLSFSGSVDGRLGWDRTGAQSIYDPFTVGASLSVANPSIQTKTTEWSQPGLDLEVVAETQIDQGNNFFVSKGRAILVAGQDKLEARLLEPVNHVSVESVFPIELNVSGNVDTWLAQISPFVALENVDADGGINASTKAYVSMQRLAIRDINTQLTQLAGDIYGLRIREPKVTLSGNIDLNLLDGSILADQVTLVSSTVAASANAIRYQPQQNGGLEGTIAFRADVARLSSWFPQLDSSEVYWFGEATGAADLKYQGRQINGKVSATVKNLVAAQPRDNAGAINQPKVFNVANSKGWDVLWQEDQAELNSTLNISEDLNHLRLENLAINSRAVSLLATGQVRNLQSTKQLDLQGTWTPSFDELNNLIAAYTGDQIRVRGGESQPFQISGPLVPPANSLDKQGNAWIANTLRAETQLSWQQIELFGLSIGPASATTRLANSAAAVQTNSIPIGRGSIQLAPVVHLRGAAPTIVVPESTIAERVELTRDNCRSWLKYVAPFVADASSSQGTFSISTSGLRVPLANVRAAKGNANVMIHNAEVGPGPLGQQIIGIANQVKSIIEGPNASNVANQQGTWLVMPEQNIPVEIRGGRVFHQNVTFQAGSMTVQTRGSVGLDQTISMVAEVPILDRWIGDRAYLNGLRGQKISIPISGTLSKPQLDTRVLGSLATQLLQSSAQGAVQNELNNLIQKEGQKIQDKLFNGILNPNPRNTPANSQQPSGSGTGNLLDDALNKGLDKIFGPKK